MKNQQHLTHHNPERLGTNLFSRLNTNPKLSIALITLSYVILLILSYNLGSFLGSTFGIKDITTSVISKTTSLPSQDIIPRSSEPRYNIETQCAEVLPSELIQQTIIDHVYNGTSPYENFIPPRVTSFLLPKRINGWGSYGVIYKSLINKVRPKTIIKLSTSSGVSATYMANLTSQLGLKTQILCLAMPNDDIMLPNQFIQNVISQNATESILPVPLSIHSASGKLCEWGIYGDLIEVDAGHNFHSAWSNISKAYKLLRPGGILFGHNYISSDSSYYDNGVKQAVRLFARVNKFHAKVEGHHWMINLV